MTALAGIRNRVLQFLGDLSGTKFSANLVDEAITQALGEYSMAWPQIKLAVITLAAAGREVDLAELSGFLSVLELVYPYDASNASPQARGDYYFYWLSGSPVLHVGGKAVPQAGEKLRLYYGTAHTIEDLQNAAATSIRPDHESLIVQGAAGHAAILRGAVLSEAYGSRQGDSKTLAAWGNAQLGEYRKRLQELRQETAPPRPFTGWPARGWQLDEWDA